MKLKRRFQLSILLIFGVICSIIYMDYRLLFGNPLEVRSQTERLLQKYLGQFNPEFDDIEIGDKVSLKGLTLRKPGTKEVLLTAASVEIQLGIQDFRNLVGLKSVTVNELLVQAEFSSYFDLDSPDEPEKPDDNSLSELLQTIESVSAKIPANVELKIQNSRVQLYDTHMKKAFVVKVRSILGTIRSGFQRQGLSILTKGQLDIGIVVKNTHPEYSKGVSESGIPRNSRLLSLIKNIRFDVERRADGILRTLIRCERVDAHQAMGEAMSEWPKKNIWDELNPEGHLKAEVTVDYIDGEIDYVVNLWPQGMACTLNEFRYRVTDIYGKFWVKDKVVTWDQVTGKTRGEGTVSGRGTVYIGRPEESVIIHSENEFANVPIEAEVEAAIRDADDSAYKAFKLFQPTGKASGLLTITSTEIDGAAPGIAIRVDDLGGTLNAKYKEVPVPVKNFKGAFRLMEGGGVEFNNIEFDIDEGGTAVASGRLLANELIFVDIQTKDVVIKPELLKKLPPKVQKYIEPLQPQSGMADVRVVVRKSDPNGKAVPDVDIKMNSLVIKPVDFPRPIALNGDAQIRLAYPEGTGEDDDVNPDVTVKLNVLANSLDKRITNSSVKGLIRLIEPRDKVTTEKAKFVSDLDIVVNQVDLNSDIVAAMPKGISKAVAQFSPQGRVKNLTIKFRDVDDLEFYAEGQSLRVAFKDFPVAARPSFFAMKVRKRQIILDRIIGQFDTGGQFTVSGAVLRPAETLNKDLSYLDKPVFDLNIGVENVVVNNTLINAFPATLAEPLLKIQPTGHCDAQLFLSYAPIAGLDLDPSITGTINIKEAGASVFELIDESERFSNERITNLKGQIELTPEKVEFRGIQGTFLSSQVSVAGFIRRPSETPLFATDNASALEKEQSFQIKLKNFNLGAKTHENVPTAAHEILNEYQPEGPVDIQLSLVKHTDKPYQTSLKLYPRGMRATPKVIGAKLDQITGVIEVIDDKPTLIDLTGMLEGAPFTVRRSEFDERGGPADSLRLFTHLNRFDFRKEAVNRFPDALRKLITGLKLQGKMDATNVFQFWQQPEKPAIWLSELVPHDLTMTTGIPLEHINGAIHLAGQLQPEPDFRGGFNFRTMSTFKQPVNQLRGFLRFKDGQFILTELLGRIHGGRITGYAQFNSKTETYLGTINLSDLSFAQTLNGLYELNQNPEEAKKKAELPDTPTTGRLYAKLNFSGNKSTAKAYGSVRIKNSNAIAVPLVSTLTKILRAQGKNVSNFDRIKLNFVLGGEGSFQYADISADSFLRSSTIDLSISGRIWLAGPRNGQIRLRIIPVDVTDDIGPVSWFTRLLKSQLVSFRALGTLSEPRVSYVLVSRVWEALEKGADLLTPENQDNRNNGDPFTPPQRPNDQSEPQKQSPK